jgi:hypothetical protein
LVSRQDHSCVGFEQANKYAIKDGNGQDVGFIAEDEHSWTSALLRQLLRTRRAFHAVVLNQQGQPILRVMSPESDETIRLKGLSSGS